MNIRQIQRANHEALQKEIAEERANKKETTQKRDWESHELTDRINHAINYKKNFGC